MKSILSSSQTLETPPTRFGPFFLRAPITDSYLLWALVKHFIMHNFSQVSLWCFFWTQGNSDSFCSIFIWETLIVPQQVFTCLPWNPSNPFNYFAKSRSHSVGIFGRGVWPSLQKNPKKSWLPWRSQVTTSKMWETKKHAPFFLVLRYSCPQQNAPKPPKTKNVSIYI